MLNVVILHVIMQSVIMLNVVILHVATQSVIRLNVLAPIMPKPQQEKNGSLEMELLKRFFKINSVLQIWVLPDLSLSQWPI